MRLIVCAAVAATASAFVAPSPSQAARQAVRISASREGSTCRCRGRPRERALRSFGSYGRRRRDASRDKTQVKTFGVFNEGKGSGKKKGLALPSVLLFGEGCSDDRLRDRHGEGEAVNLAGRRCLLRATGPGRLQLVQ